MKLFLLIAILAIRSYSIFVELQTGGYSASDFANYIVGDNVIVSGATGHFASQSAAVYKDAFVEVGTESLLFNGVALSSGSAYYLNSNYNTAANKTLQLGLPPDAQLQSLLPSVPYVQTYDACYIEFDFVPDVSGQLNISYVFGSEEYFYRLDHNYERYHDVFGIFIDGENIATLPDGTPVGVKTINQFSNYEYFNSNEFGSNMYASEMNGFTNPLTAAYNVVAGNTYHAKIGVTDANDLSYDSWALIGQNSFRVESVPEPETVIMIIIGVIIFGCLFLLDQKNMIGNYNQMKTIVLIATFCVVILAQQSWKVPIEPCGKTYIVTFCTVEKPHTSIHIPDVYAVIDTVCRGKSFYRIVKNPSDIYIQKSKYYFQRWIIQGNTAYW